VTNKPRYVLDTNVIVSALLFPASVPGNALIEALNRGELLLSAETIEEVASVLRRPKFDPYVRPEERNLFLATLIRRARLVQPTEHLSLCRDPNDNKWLELALAGEAALVITGDDDLIALNPFRNSDRIARAISRDAVC
jgi:uncharacterized protein